MAPHEDVMVVLAAINPALCLRWGSAARAEHAKTVCGEPAGDSLADA
jgi:hypothetical protein